MAHNKETQRAYNKAYYAKNKERERERANRWARENRERKAATNTAWKQLNKDHVNAEVKRWQLENPERYAQINYKARLKLRCKKFGITVDDYFAMLAEQGGKCRVCGRSEIENGRDLAIDHNHKTGKVRGLLCHHCNAALGHMREDVSLLRRLIDYIKRS